MDQPGYNGRDGKQSAGPGCQEGKHLTHIVETGNGVVASEETVMDWGCKDLEDKHGTRYAPEVKALVEALAELMSQDTGSVGIGNGLLANTGSGLCFCSAEISKECQSCLGGIGTKALPVDSEC